MSTNSCQREDRLKLMYHQMSEKYCTLIRKTLDASVIRRSEETQKRNEDIRI